MESLSARELLRAWEQGHSRHSVQRGVLLLGAACPDLDGDALASLTIGERDRLLFELREQIFGSRLLAVVSCPSCDERVELALQTDDLVGGRLDSDSEPFHFQMEGYALGVRPLTCSDLSAVRGVGELPVARDLLMERSIVSVEHEGQPVRVSDLPAHVLDFISNRMAEADPLSNIQLSITCSVCAHRWNEILDITSFFWTEIDAWAYRTLDDVHRLASAYGWTESEILGMTAWRRDCYLKLIGK